VFNTQTAQWKRQGKIEGMTDKEIDDYLKEITSTPFQIDGFKTFKYFDNNETEVKEEKTKKEEEEALVEKFTKSFNYEYLCSEVKLIRPSNKDDGIVFFSLTKKGRKVIRIGGWLKYLERQDEIEKRKEEKENLELQITKAHAKYPYLPYWLAFGGVFVSFLAFINSCNSENKTSQDKQQKVVYIVKDTLYENYHLKDTILK
jgi:hypothetical protein